MAVLSALNAAEANREKVVYSFAGGADESYPNSLLKDKEAIMTAPTLMAAAVATASMAAARSTNLPTARRACLMPSRAETTATFPLAALSRTPIQTSSGRAKKTLAFFASLDTTPE